MNRLMWQDTKHTLDEMEGRLVAFGQFPQTAKEAVRERKRHRSTVETKRLMIAIHERHGRTRRIPVDRAPRNAFSVVVPLPNYTNGDLVVA